MPRTHPSRFLAGLVSHWQAGILALWGMGLIVVGVGSVWPGDGPPVPWESAHITHFLAYCALAMLPVALYPGPRLIFLVVGGMTAYGGVIEVIQHFLPYRHGSGLDAGVNLLGASTGAAIGFVAGTIRKRLA